MERIAKSFVLIPLLYMGSLAMCLLGLYKAYDDTWANATKNFSWNMIDTPSLIFGIVASFLFAVSGYFIGRVFTSTRYKLSVSTLVCFGLSTCFFYPSFSLFMWMF